jgi:hypothetical protein
MRNNNIETLNLKYRHDTSTTIATASTIITARTLQKYLSQEYFLNI